MSNNNLNLGNLDFSALLAGAANGSGAPAPAPAPPPPPPALAPAPAPTPAAALQTTQSSSSPSVAWPNMTVNDARENNNIKNFISLLISAEHPNLLKELSHFDPTLHRTIMNVLAENSSSNNGGENSSSSDNDIKKNLEEKVYKAYQEHNVKMSISSASHMVSKKSEEESMRQRLLIDPMDAEANKYFGEKIRLENVQRSYFDMMEQFPESMGKVLMLYVTAEVNGLKFPCFVDSGAQSTIMSSHFADKCGLLHLLDDRFEGTAVGVGTGKILGRIHLAEIKIAGCHFPCTFTVMDSDGKGLGDKNMDMLFGLDMLKRHRCNIDLANNCLVFNSANGPVTAPFMHEYELGQEKGGTKGFDVQAANEEQEKMEIEYERKRARSESGQEGDGEKDKKKSDA